MLLETLALLLCLACLATAATDSTNEFRVLVNSTLEDFKAVTIPAGRHEFFRISGIATLQDVQVSDCEGNLFVIYLNNHAAPANHGVALISYPRLAFDTVSQIDLYLPHPEDWVLNIAEETGRPVAHFSGNDSGRVIIHWTPLDILPPGLYTCSVKAGTYSRTRTLILER